MTQLLQSRQDRRGVVVVVAVMRVQLYHVPVGGGSGGGRGLPGSKGGWVSNAERLVR